jgi:molecular chaperone GrpE (heat shock protein)
VEQVTKERAQLEAEFQAFMAKAQTESQKLREEHAVLLKSVQDLKDQQAVSEEAKAQMKQWEQIEKRLRAQLEELEEKHEVMRVGLSVDESTVLMFANDLIKRIDLIDSLRTRYAGTATGDVAEQLYTLRASVEDVLLQHGIVEFEVEPGTVVDVDLRKRITVVDAVAGKDRPRVVETFRSGFLRVMDDGQERILRKVEVRTSSQGG